MFLNGISMLPAVAVVIVVRAEKYSLYQIVPNKVSLQCSSMYFDMQKFKSTCGLGYLMKYFKCLECYMHKYQWGAKSK